MSKKIQPLYPNTQNQGQILLPSFELLVMLEAIKNI